MPFVPLLAAFPEVAVALLAALLALGVYLLLRGIAAFIASLHVSVSLGPINIDPASWFRGAANSVASWVVGVAKGTWAHIAHWVYGHAWVIEQFAVNTVQAIGHLGGQVAFIVEHAIPNAVRAGERDVARAVNSLERTIGIDAHKAAIDLQHALSTADRAIYHAEASVTSLLEHGIKSAVASGVDAAEDFTAREITDLRAYVDARARAIEAAAAAAAEGALDVANGAAANVDALQQALFASLGVVGVAGLTTVLSDALAATREFESCGVTNCGNPKNDFSNLLKAALGLAEFAGLGAFLAELIGQPAQAAAIYAPIVEGTFGAGQTALDALLSL